MKPILILLTTFGVYITMKGRFAKYMDLASTKAAAASGNASPPASVSSPSGVGGSSQYKPVTVDDMSNLLSGFLG